MIDFPSNPTVGQVYQYDGKSWTYNGVGWAGQGAVNVGPVSSVAVTAGTGINVTGSPITSSGTINVTNTAPDQVVALTGSGATSVTGTYPNFTINSTGGGSVTSVAATGGTGISITGSPITTSGTLNITNTAPDQVVALTGAGTTSITGTYPNFTITSADSTVGTVTSVGGTGTVNGISLSGTVTASGNLTLGGTLSGTASGLTAGNVTTNANLTGAVTSAGNATSLGSFTSAELAAAVTNETGSGSLVFATSPTLVTPALGTPASAVLTNATGLPLTTGVTGALPVANGGTSLATLTANNVIIGNGTAAPLFVAPSTSGNVLTSNGTTWTSAASPSVTIASAAEAIAGTNNTNVLTPLRLRDGLNASGSAPVFAARAWVNFNGTGTVAIRASGNVSSITDNGVGTYVVNFSAALPDAAYGISSLCSGNTTDGHNNYIAGVSGTRVSAVAAGSCPINVTNGGTTNQVDVPLISVSFFR